MRRSLFTFLLLSITTLALIASPMEEQYLLLKKQFDNREKTAQNMLRQYLVEYPYTTYYSNVQMMLGVLQAEKNKYKQALKCFDKVEWKDLGREQQPLFFFYRGYSYIQMNNMNAAASCFKVLKDSSNPYALQAKYYYAYCSYLEGNYKKALPDFLQLESTPQYKTIVPYYVVQIYYAQQQYDEVYTRAEELLKNNPENKNNREIHRILGELYFAKSDYVSAAKHLSLYQQQSTTEKAEMVRNDLYLLAMTQYYNKEYKEAVQSFKQVKLLKDTISESTCLHMGHAYVHLQDIEHAKLAYAAAMDYGIKAKVKEEAMYNYTLTTYQSSTALGESIKAFHDFLTQYPNSKHATDVYQLLAGVYMNAKNYLSALNAITAIPNQTAKMKQIIQYLQYQIGVDAFLQGNMKECQERMTTVIEDKSYKANSDYKNDAYFYRAEACYRLHQYEECYNNLHTFLSLPDNQSSNLKMVHYLMGYSLFSLKQYAEAEVEFQQFIAQPNLAANVRSDALNRIGDCCFNARAFTDAIAAYQKVLDTPKGTGQDYALFQMAYAHGLLRHYEKKATLMEKLVITYPKSDYADDALYELARANLQDEKNEDAIQAYARLVTNYPNSNYARKASLEMAMIYRNIKKNDEAISQYQRTITLYPASEEAYASLEGLEQIYVETNRIAEYIAFTKQLGKMNMNVSNQEDSLTYVTAELQYMNANYAEAAEGLMAYLNQFCTGGRYCTTACWYAADCYYRIGKMDDALSLYSTLADTPGNPYKEETTTRLAELLYEKKDYSTARKQFEALKTLATKRENTNAACVGIMRCSFFLNDDSTTITIASQIIRDKEVSESLREEALYNRAKAYYRTQNYGLAVKDFFPLSKNVRVVTGAESSYLLAECYFLLDALDSAETEIMRFAEQKTQHQYWLAKSFILLSDINVKREDYFQAKQYLLSLKDNYSAKDDIISIINDRLSQIEQFETPEQPIQEEEEEEL